MTFPVAGDFFVFTNLQNKEIKMQVYYNTGHVYNESYLLTIEEAKEVVAYLRTLSHIYDAWMVVSDEK